MFNFMAALAALAVAGWLVFDAVRLFRAATGSFWQRLIAAGQGSATILWQRIVIVVSTAAAWLAYAAEAYLDDPSLSASIQTLMQPERVAWLTIAVALVSIWARRRTL